ncbi:MAG: hypothetical protein AB7P00_41855, partial [Sandaracinaceae bacterium]
TLRAEPCDAAGAFSNAWRTISRRQMDPLDDGQCAFAAEAECLLAPKLDMRTVADLGLLFNALIDELVRSSDTADVEDAVDSATFLAGLADAERRARVAAARELLREAKAMSTPLRLSHALLLMADVDTPPHAVHAKLAVAGSALGAEIANKDELLNVAVALAYAHRDLMAQLERFRVVRDYLGRFAPEGMGAAAALLSWVALEPAELLDDLRLCAAEIQRARLADGGAQTMSLAIKLLVSMAALAAGREGDLEESLALAPRLDPRAGRAHLASAIGALPMVAPALAAFHRPVLDAAREYEQVYQSMHSSYVFGGHRRVGWG